MNANDYYDEVNIAIIHSYRKTGITFHKYTSAQVLRGQQARSSFVDCR